jgi:uncharacterized ion transporter superfamily protein YfcC
MKKRKFPTAQTILIVIAAFVAVLTWVIPSGKYDTLIYNKNGQYLYNTEQRKDNSNSCKSKIIRPVKSQNPARKFHKWGYLQTHKHSRYL